MTIRRYVHADSTGGADGTTVVDAYTTIQAAIDDAAAWADPATDDYEIYICEPAAGKYVESVECDITGSADGSSDDFTAKFVGCTTLGVPHTTRDTRLTIESDNLSSEVWKMVGGETNGNHDNVYFYSLDFNSAGNDTQAFRSDNGDMGVGYGWLFANCRFRNALTYNTAMQSDQRGISFYDCDWDNDDNASANYYLIDSAYSAFYKNCKFKSNHSSSSHGLLTGNALTSSIFLNCWFDANGSSNCVRVSQAIGVSFENCAFYNYVSAAIRATSTTQFVNFINCTADGQAAGDLVWEKEGTTDFNPGIHIGNLSNSTSVEGWTDSDGALAPYIVSGSENVDGSTAGVNSVTDPRWTNFTEARQGAKDLFGVRAMVGPENLNSQKVRGKPRTIYA